MVAINAIDDPCSRSSEFMVSLRFFKVFFREIDLNNTHLCIFCKLDPLINPQMKFNFASKIISNQNKLFKVNHSDILDTTIFLVCLVPLINSDL